jgi:hypothetical protein
MTLFCGPRSKLTPAYVVKKRDLHLDAFTLLVEPVGISVPIGFKIGRYERLVKAKHLKVRVDASGEFDTITLWQFPLIRLTRRIENERKPPPHVFCWPALLPGPRAPGRTPFANPAARLAK